MCQAVQRFLRQSGQVAQLVEQRTENPCVGGSIPSLATIPHSLIFWTTERWPLRFTASLATIHFKNLDNNFPFSRFYKNE